MKVFLPIALGIVSLGLAIALYMTRQNDTAQHVADVGSITEFSNMVDSAKSQIADRDTTLLNLTNTLTAAQSASTTLSNQLTDAQSAITSGAQQITNLTQQVAKLADVEAGNQMLEHHARELTNQIASLSQQLAATATSLTHTNSDLAELSTNFLLLENRFRIDVAERTVVERKFNNPTELKTQMKKLKKNPAGVITADSIYAGLDVEVKSNGTVHVISPN